jgi:hypothetical protein
MASTMSMNKVIHRAFRRDLDRFVDALGRFRAGDHERAAGLGRAWDNFEDQLTHHHTGEHEIAWPALRRLGVSDELLAQLDAEHDVMAGALGDALTAMTRLRTSASADDAAAAKAAFEQLRTVTIAHLDHEENEVEDVYLTNVDSPVVKEMGKQFAKVSPSRGGRFFAWLVDGATPEEKAAATSDIPAPVLAVISGVFGRGYRKNVAPVWRS